MSLYCKSQSPLSPSHLTLHTSLFTIHSSLFTLHYSLFTPFLCLHPKRIPPGSKKQRTFRSGRPLLVVFQVTTPVDRTGCGERQFLTLGTNRGLGKRNGVCHTQVITGNPYREQMRSRDQLICHSVLSNMRLFSKDKLLNCKLFNCLHNAIY